MFLPLENEKPREAQEGMGNDRLHRALEASPLFQGLPPREMTLLLEIAREKWFPKNSLLFSEGETANGFYLVVSGKVKVFKISPDGKEQILHIFGPGEPVGEVAVFSGRDFPANASTLKESSLLYLPRTGFMSLAHGQPQILMNMLATLSMRLRKFTLQIERLSLREVGARLAEALLEMTPEPGPAGRRTVELTITKGQLANQIGTTPETLSRTLQKMTRQGLIQVQRKRLVLLDPAGLEELALGGNPADA